LDLQTMSSDDDFIIPKPSTKRQKTIKSKKLKPQLHHLLPILLFRLQLLHQMFPQKASHFLIT
jgi:hypothetical protein